MDQPDKRILQHRNVINAAKANGVKKIVYTSIIGAEVGNAFSPVVSSNRQTEKDIKESDLDWAIGRNGLYIEPDLEYIDTYIKEGGIVNCAGEGKCGYTSRTELAFAYFKLLTNNLLNKKTYNLIGKPITQLQLVDAINKNYNTNLIFKNITVEKFRDSRISDLGEFLGTVIGGIYEGIESGSFDRKSDFKEVTGRPHYSTEDMIKTYKKEPTKQK